MSLGTSSESKDQIVLQRLIELFDISRAGNYQAAARFIAYKGNDKLREYRDTCNFSDEYERRLVESICNRIKGWLEESEDHEFGEFLTQQQAEGEWCAWEVFFHRGADRRVRYFGFLLVKGQYVLGDIDR